MTAKRFAYKSSDAWMLLAIVYAGRDGGADVSAIVAAGDYINHAIFTFGEFQNALFKLTSDGFVREEGGLFFPTAAALDFRSPRRASKKTHAVRVDLDEIEQLLRSAPWSPGPDQFRQEHTYPAVTAEDFDAGVRAYSKRMEAFMAKGRRSRTRRTRSK